MSDPGVLRISHDFISHRGTLLLRRAHKFDMSLIGSKADMRLRAGNVGE
jgi:hypothetical protein